MRRNDEHIVWKFGPKTLPLASSSSIMSRRVSTYDILPVDEALSIVLKHSETLPQVRVKLNEATERVLAQDVFAKDALPPFRASIMDGYALIAEDGPGDYPVVMEVMAGTFPTQVLQPKTIARITTGAPVPEGANAVIKVEDTLLLNEKTASNQDIVKIEKASKVGQDIRPIGSDVEVGQLVLSKGTLLRAAEIGILATVGASEVEVYPHPVVGILSTGDELVEPSTSHSLGPGQIRDSNRYMLLSALHELNCKTVDLGISSDSSEDLKKRILAGLSQSDILLTSGGVSMGELDLIKPLLESIGTVHFGRVHMKPGKPLTFASMNYEGRNRLVFGLPGNPVSSLVTFTLFVVPSIRKISGHANPHHQVVQAKTTSDIRLDNTRPEYHRATLSWDLTQQCYVATSTGRQISSRLLSMVSATAFLLIPQGEGKLAAGSLVSALVVAPYL